MNDHNENELDWLAFQYIADELPPEEAAAFELRLADDQMAREAVARAVEVSQAAAAAFDLEPAVTVAPATPARWSALWWMACGAAACLAAVAAFHVWPTGQGARPLASPDLARAWSEARDHVPAGPDLASEVRGLVDGEAAELSDPDSQHATPSWLMAALSDDDMDGTPALDDEMMQTPPGKKGEG